MSETKSGVAPSIFDDQRAQFTEGMSKAVSSVVVVATDGPAGRGGLTVSSMSSVSADGPHPILLVCVHHLSPVAAAIIKNEVLCVNLLSSDQAKVSDCFAGRHSEEFADKFSCASWSKIITGAPALDGAVVNFDCRLIETKEVATHHVFFCEVVGMRQQDAAPTLAYSRRSYCEIVTVK
jgi:flavin reductase (DIM6/NTAB) family NADH-FMN oxidoreductase RutF